jgi:hypothetical protein
MEMSKTRNLRRRAKIILVGTIGTTDKTHFPRHFIGQFRDIIRSTRQIATIRRLLPSAPLHPIDLLCSSRPSCPSSKPAQAAKTNTSPNSCFEGALAPTYVRIKPSFKKIGILLSGKNEAYFPHISPSISRHFPEAALSWGLMSPLLELR